jgi:hypothetical protein
MSSSIPVLPGALFNERLPGYAKLPGLQIKTKKGSGEIIFRSASQAVLAYDTGPLEDHLREIRLWGGLPISSVRRVTAVQSDLRHGKEDIWLAGLIGELEFLELLELRGDCGHVLRRLRVWMARGEVSVGIKALVVRGGEYAKRQAFKFDCVKGALGLENMTVTYIPDPGSREEFSDIGSSSEGNFDSDGSYSGESDENGENGDGDEVDEDGDEDEVDEDDDDEDEDVEGDEN